MKKDAPLPDVAAVYSRVSTKQQEDGVSLGTQEEACIKLARAKGFAVPNSNIFQEVHTGAELYDRDVLREVRKLITTRQIGILVVYAIDRLSRDEAHLSVVLSEAQYAGVEIAFVTEPLDSSPEGGLIRFIRAYGARLEREKFRERSIRGKAAVVQAGFPVLGSRPPFGYQWKEEEHLGKRIKVGYVVDEMKAPIVHRIFELAARGEPLRAIARQLNDDGVETATGRSEWYGATVRCILNHDIYHTGDQVAFVDRKHKKTTLEPVTLPGVAPIIVPETLSHLARTRLHSNKAMAARNIKDPEHTLLRNGFIRCGYCDAVFSYSSRASEQAKKAGHYARYVNACREFGCPNMSMTVAKLDELVWDKVCSIVEHPLEVEAFLAQRGEEDPTKMDQEGIERRLAQIDRRRKNLISRVQMVDDDEIAQDMLAQASLLNADAEKLRTELTELQEIRASWDDQAELLRSASAWMSTVKGRLREFSYSEKRDVLIALQAVVIVTKEDGKVDPKLRMALDGVASHAPTPFSRRVVNTRSPSSSRFQSTCSAHSSIASGCGRPRRRRSRRSCRPRCWRKRRKRFAPFTNPRRALTTSSP